MIILTLLMFLVLGMPFSAPAAETGTAVPEIRYFQYWIKCGDRANCPHGYRPFSFELMSGRMNVTGPVPGDNFCGAVDASVSRELSLLVAGLDLQNWKGVQPGRDPFELTGKNDGKSCVWSLRIIFEKDASGRAHADIRLSGMDDGTCPKRLNAESALVKFFSEKCHKAQKSALRRVESLMYSTGQGSSRVFYSLSSEDGRVELSRIRQGKKISEYVTADILSRLDALIRKYSLDAWNGFNGTGFDRRAASAFDLHLEFDSRQQIRARGNADRPDGRPPQFLDVDGALRTLLDSALGDDAEMEKADLQNGIHQFSFSTSGMSMDMFVSYEIYRRRGIMGARMILSRKRGNEERVETVLDRTALDRLTAYVQQNLKRWNGFRGSAAGVLDGTGFSLTVRFADGTTLRAHGENAFPARYHEHRKAVFQYLDRLLDAVPGKDAENISLE